MAIQSAEQKFLHELEDQYDAEQQFLTGQHEMLSNAAFKSLRDMLSEHIAESEHQVKNLEEIFKALGKEPRAVACAGARGILQEARQVMDEAENPAIRDALICSAAAKVEHYEIALYQSLVTSAEHMKVEAKDHKVKKEQENKRDKLVQLLQENLNQEETTARKIEAGAKELEERVHQYARTHRG